MITDQDYSCLLQQIRAKAQGKNHFIIAIDGNSAAGKSTLGQRLAQDLQANLYKMDDFFLQREQRTKERLAEVGGNVDYERFKDEVLTNISGNSNFSYRVYDCQIWDFKGQKFFRPNLFHLVEGSYSRHPYFGSVYDFTIFLETDTKEQNERILKRNGPLLYRRFIEEWVPKENAYFDAFSIKDKADLVLKT